MKDWKIFTGSGVPHDHVEDLPDPPPWRDFEARRRAIAANEDPRGKTFRVRPREVELVNAALYLRRPLFVTGPPGSGKSSLAFAVARELKLGRVLRWPINSRSTLEEGLYHYDALARLRDLKSKETLSDDDGSDVKEGLGLYIKLGPLGTALLPQSKPRVLLIDEIDKADIDLPNDLLHVFEEGEFEIPELLRVAADVPRVKVRPADSRHERDRVEVEEGVVSCTSFPIVVLTSNAEREMPPAFRRRCLSLTIEPPGKEELREIVAAHFEDADLDESQDIIDRFVYQRDDENSMMATDQLLNAVFLLTRGRSPRGEEGKRVLELILRELDRG